MKTQEKKLITVCNECADEIYEGEEMYKTQGECYCSAHCVVAVYIPDVEHIEAHEE